MSSAAAAISATASTGGSFNPLQSLDAFLERLGAARRCAAAISADRRPDKRDLAVLGLEGLDFDNLPR